MTTTWQTFAFKAALFALMCLSSWVRGETKSMHHWKQMTGIKTLVVVSQGLFSRIVATQLWFYLGDAPFLSVFGVPFWSHSYRCVSREEVHGLNINLLG